jgi:activin receptor type-1
MTLFLVCVYYLRRHKLAVERNRRVPQGMKEAKPTGEMELMDMTVTSGSGSGLPFLIQRTVARTIKITELIGNGRYGQVYLGYYQGEPVAVKKFFSRDEKSWCRETEIYNTLLLRHDNILGFFASDMVSNNGVTELWLITQYHQFGSLYDFLMQEAVSPKVMLLMAISMCSGLAHLHTELFGTQAKPAITHRDMKTKNVLVKNNMTCCIADFGLAVFKNQNEMNIPTNPKQGTKRYMAPEILNETINMMSFESFKHVDVYALGLILWELCRRCTGTSGVPEDYEVPLQGMVPPDPSFEDMRRVVVVERRQPAIPPRWNTEELLREVTKVMRECWYYTSTARPTAVYLKKKLLKMSQELEKMNYGDHDVQQAT